MRVEQLLLGGDHPKAEIMLLPCYKGGSTLAVGVLEGQQWMRKIRSKVHEITSLVSKAQGGTALPSPSKLISKNTTRWAKGILVLPEEYQKVVELKILGRDDLWYFLDCEACIEAVGLIRSGKKLAQLPRAVLDKALALKEYYVGDSLAQTLDSLPEEDGLDSSGWDSDWSGSSDGSDGPRYPRFCVRCQEEFRAREWGSCPNCGDP